MVNIKQAGVEPFPGYRLSEFLGRGGFGEVWKCQVPGGLFKAVKFVPFGCGSLHQQGTGAQEREALERIKGIRHPFLLSVERVEVVGDELVMVTELADKSLADRLRECRAQGLAGIAAEELLPVLAEAAEALDVLNLQFGLQHLDIKPGNLFLVGNHLKVADFGLVREVERSRVGVVPLASPATPLYCSPEVFTGQVSSRSDQYSLAVVYQELLAGKLPFTGDNARQLMLQHMQGVPDLMPLPPAERPVVARALAKDPGERFPCCLDFIRALLATREHISIPTRLLLVQRPAGPLENVPAPTASPPAVPAENTNDLGGGRPERSPGSAADTAAPASQTPVPTTDPGPRLPALPARAPATAPVSGPLTIPGYRMVKCLSQNNPGPMWRIEGPDKRCHVARLLPLELHQGATALTCFLERLRQAQHPALPALGVVRSSHGTVLLARDCEGESLAARYQECVAQRLPGIPREELLALLAAAAEALDTLGQEEGLWHAGLNPFSLLIEEDGFCFTDFALVHQLWLPAGLPLARCYQQYAAPEVLRGEAGERSDQYSLALIFAEMLTGFHVRPRTTLGSQRGPCKLDLTMLASSDQQFIRKALSDRPEDRFASCSELIDALRGGRQPREKASNRLANRLGAVLPIAALGGNVGGSDGLAVTPERLVAQAFEQSGLRGADGFRDGIYWRPADRTLECRLPLPVSGLTLNLKLRAFAETVGGTYERHGTNSFTVYLPTAARKSFWSRLRQQQSGLEVHVVVDPPAENSLEQTEAAVRIVPVGAAQFEEPHKVKALADELVNQLHAALGLEPEQRAHVRVAFTGTVHVYTVSSSQQVGSRIEGKAKDLSLGGLRATLAEPPTTPLLYLHFPEVPALKPYAILARLVHLKRLANQTWDLGVSFAPASDTGAGAPPSRPRARS
jgi:serine/threonine protein kinase